MQTYTNKYIQRRNETERYYSKTERYTFRTGKLMSKNVCSRNAVPVRSGPLEPEHTNAIIHKHTNTYTQT